MLQATRTPNCATEPASRWRLTAALALVVASLPLSEASAYSLRVKMACAGDYYSHCSAYSLDSQELRQCMRTTGPALSKSCVSALVADGEVSKAEVARRSASLR